MIINIQKYDEIMRELQDFWEQNRITFMENHGKAEGIRSSQIAALVALLIEKGVFDKKEKAAVLFDRGTN